MKQKKLVMVGCAESGYHVIKELLESGFKFDYFVTITKEKAIQANASGYFDFSVLAKKYQIPVYYCEKYALKSHNDIQFFKEQQFDLLIQGGWQRLFPDEILKTFSIGAIGIHGSADFLPKGRGRSPLNWSLIENKKRFIMHYFLINPGIDDGDVFHYEMFDINEWDDIKTLYYKNSMVTLKVLKEYIPKILNQSVTFYTQKGAPSYYPKRTKEDGHIDWKKPVLEIYNLIRAVTKPYPGAFTNLFNSEITVWKAQPFDTRIDDIEFNSGQVIQTFENGDFIVKCGDGLLLVTEYDSENQIIKNQQFE